jgi:hypothetical protein
MLRKLRDELSAAREAWDQFSKGGAVGLPRFQDAIAPVIDQARALDQPEVAEIAAALGDLARWLRQDPLRLTDALSMDVATTMLVLDTRLDAHARPDLAEDVQIGSLLDRLKAHQRGERLSPLAIVESDAQSRQVNRQLVHEIQTSLAEVEQSLDSFFRAPARPTSWPPCAPLKQVEGALSVMNEDAAMRLVQDAAARIAALSAPDADTGTEAFEEIAHRLSALGVYIEALQHGPADLERILRPDAGKAGRRQHRGRARPAEARNRRPRRRPQGQPRRRRPAHRAPAQPREPAPGRLLTADLELEKQARQALTLLDAGELFTEATPLPQAPAAPALSAEATRLLEASEEELDAELLAIFLEEAEDVRDTIAARLAELVRNPTTSRCSPPSGAASTPSRAAAAWSACATSAKPPGAWSRPSTTGCASNPRHRRTARAHRRCPRRLLRVDRPDQGRRRHPQGRQRPPRLAERLRSSGDAPAAEAIAPPPPPSPAGPAAPDMAATQVMSNFSFGALEDDAALEALEALENEALENEPSNPSASSPSPSSPTCRISPSSTSTSPQLPAPRLPTPPSAPSRRARPSSPPIEPAPAAFDLDFELPGTAPEPPAALDFDFTHDEAPAAPPSRRPPKPPSTSTSSAAATPAPTAGSGRHRAAG